MFASGIEINNTSIIGAFVTPAVVLPHGMQGVIVCQTGAGLDTAITNLTVNLKLSGVSGSGYVVAHSSKVLTTNCMIGPVYLPAGEYVARTLGGSSITSAYIGFFPTP